LQSDSVCRSAIWKRYLSEALSAGGDYADLYFEYLATTSLGIDEGILKSATAGVTLGVGIRVLAGERTGYAYSDDLSADKISKLRASQPASHAGPASIVTAGFHRSSQTRPVSDALDAERIHSR
jgi:TldD protein